jgi:hypothetical protein
MHRSCALFLVVFSARPSYAEFLFNDFNVTQSLNFRGDAGTTSCIQFEQTKYSPTQNVADEFYHEQEPEGGERSMLNSQSTTETDDPLTTSEVGLRSANIGHRDFYKRSKESLCPVRTRLTPSGPSKVGALWYHMPIAVVSGFETLFTFQISDHSRECSKHRDPTFSTAMYESCTVHGGDGFAFVIQRDDDETEALGTSGNGLGYEGIRNSVAVEFDTWFNPEDNATIGGTDLISDHISVHSMGVKANSASESDSLGQARPAQIGDGQLHKAKISYFPFLALEYLEKFSATASLVQYLKDNGENRRMGTLLVYIDEGIQDDNPLIAIPINLSVLLRLPQDQAYVGFTASTGLRWEKHDIINWIWCDSVPCDDDSKLSEFDYNQNTQFASKAHSPRYVPGSAREQYYGGVEALDESRDWTDRPGTKHQNPDAEPVRAPHIHYSDNRNEGLSKSAEKQIPPKTEI